jgi:hypothetical protein
MLRYATSVLYHIKTVGNMFQGYEMNLSDVEYTSI